MTVRAMFVCVVFAIGLFAGSPAFALGAVPDFLQPTCSHAGGRAFVPPGPKARLSDDDLLRTISTTTDRAKLQTAIRAVLNLDAPRDQHGTTPLIHAVGVDNWIAVQELLNAGVNANQAADDDLTPFELAVSLTHVDIACQLLAHGAVVPPPMVRHQYFLPASALAQPEADAIAMIRLLLMRGYPLDAKLPPAEQTALHVAAEVGAVDLTRFLLSQHADPTIRDAKGMTPFDVAKVLGHTDVAQLLSRTKVRR